MKVNERYKQTAIEARWAIWLGQFLCNRLVF